MKKNSDSRAVTVCKYCWTQFHRIWRCWHLRDDCVHGTGKELISGSVLFLQRYEEEWRNASLSVLSEAGRTGGTLTSLHPRPPVARQMNWVAPAQGWAKVNSDASFIPDTGCCWAGAVARDYQGLVFLSTCKSMPTACSAEEAEARAALIGLHALANGYRGPVELETD